MDEVILELSVRFRPHELEQNRPLASQSRAEQTLQCGIEGRIQFQKNFCTYQERWVSSRRV